MRIVKRYVGDCTQLAERPLMDMVDSAREISRRTFRKYVEPEELAHIERALGYSDHPARGLTMAGDAHVGYFKSSYNRKPCIYFSWSAYEHVFM